MRLPLWPVLALSIGVGAPQQAPPRDAAQAAGSAVVRGRVTAAATGQPLHRVRVTLNTSNPNSPTTVTDTRGMFELTNVPPGKYSLTARRAGYLTMQYGQRRPRESGRTFDLKDGDILEGVDMTLYRGGVLSGRIADETGEPTPGVRVEAVELRYMRGRRIPVAAGITTTNDVGEYRLSGLEPGMYQLRASTTDVWDSDDGKNSYVYAITYFPGGRRGDKPEHVNLTPGQEVSGLDMRLVAGSAARVTGVLTDANGDPMAGQVVNMDRITRTTGGALMSAGFGGVATTDARGVFEFAKLAAGEYNVYAGSQSNRVSSSVTLNEGEVRQVSLTPRPPSSVSGSIVTDDGKVPPFSAARLAIDPVAADSEIVLPPWGAPNAQPPKADWTFRLASVDGSYLFRVNGLPDDWMVKAVTLGDRDLTDTPLTIARGGPEVQGLQVVISSSGAKLSGEVLDPQGRPAPDATVIVFAEDRARWTLASRFIKAVRPDNAGRFSAAGLPPGIYRAIAREVVVAGQWEDAEFLSSLVKDAVRLELGEGASETVKLTAGPPR
jgi:hypothetical protein